MLKRRLKSLALDPDFEGSEEEKNRKLAPAEYVQKEDDSDAPPILSSLGEDDKRGVSRPEGEESK